MKIVSNTWIIINKKSKLGSMPNLLQISNSLKPGFSWWPIINSNWKVIWINYAISNWKNYGINY
jgi:S1-C subfamily serine protease